jgi:UDP-glucose 4-epimerase
LDEATNDGTELQVFGSDYPTPDGTCIRDYIHVTDLAEAHVKALEHLIGGGNSIALNLGTGGGHSVKEVIAAVEAIAGKPVRTRYGPRRAGDPPALVADPSRAESVLGWKAKRSLTEIVSTASRWYKRSHT